jgi:hypothetical protein
MGNNGVRDNFRQEIAALVSGRPPRLQIVPDTILDLRFRSPAK